MIEIPLLDRSPSTLASSLPTPVSGETDGKYFIAANDGLALVMIRNAQMAAHNVRVEPSATIAGMTAAEVEISCPPGDTWLSVFPPAIYNDIYGDVTIDDVDGVLAFTGLRI